MPILSSCISGFQTCHLFLRTTFVNAKICIKIYVITFNGFYHCKAKNRDIALKLDVCCLYVAF